MISFIVTYYNQAAYVADSLSSILRMRGNMDFEILVGDDGSTDDTVARVREFQTRYPGKIRLFVMPRDQSVRYSNIDRASANRLNLLKHARGAYFMILDGDDYYCNDWFVADAFNYLETHTDIVGYSGLYCNLTDEGVVAVENSIPTGLMHRYSFIRSHYVPAGCFLFRNKVCIDELAGQHFDDNNITIYMLNFGNIFCTDVVMYVYRQHHDSTWNSLTEAEQHLLNAYDIEDNARLCRSWQMAALSRRRNAFALKWLWRHRGHVGWTTCEAPVRRTTAFSAFVNALINWSKLSMWWRFSACWYYMRFIVANKLMLFTIRIAIHN